VTHMDDLRGCIRGPDIVGYVPSGTTATEFHRDLRDALLRDPASADVIGARMIGVFRKLWPNAPAQVAPDCVAAHMRIALRRTDLGPAPEPAWGALPEATREPLDRTSNKRRILAAARPVLDAARRQAAELKLADEAKREAARQELRAEYVRSRLNVPRRPKEGW
jgi:hypothetical protein